MNEEYLWDRSGAPDPQVQELEALLAPLRRTSELREPQPRRSAWMPLSIAASVGIIGLLMLQTGSLTATRWDVRTLAGRVDLTTLPAGEWLATDSSSIAQLTLPSTGKIEVEPNSRIRVLPSHKGDFAISLTRGMLRATIWAPPGEFSVETPSATAIDLGCIYTVQTDEAGNGFVRVDAGWVVLEEHGRESFIPGGAVCRMRRGRGPGIPYIETAAEPLKRLVTDFDETGSTKLLRSGLVSAARSDDVTLWHLLRRVPQAERRLVYNRLCSLVPPVASLKPSDEDAIWRTLRYGDADWWRKWKSR